MRYSVRVEQEAIADILQAARYIAIDRESPDYAAAWLQELWDRIADLEQWPNRHPIDPVQSAILGTPTHKILFGAYVIFFQIDEEERTVNVIGFVHGATRSDG